MVINFKQIWFTIYFIILSHKVFRLFYIQYKFEDRSLIWIVNGRIKDILFIKLN